MNKIHIRTMNETFFVNENNQIYRTGSNATMPSDSWKLMGAVEYRNVFGHSIAKIHSVEEILEGKIAWHYKNGKQKTFIMDFDHGSMRVWMSPALRYVWVAGKGRN